MVTAALINDTLSAVGAIGGLLSIVGVGLLILLVASQSRQIRAMREWIEQEPQRQQETAQRVIAEVQRRIAAARERRTGTSTPPPVGIPPLPGAASGVKPGPGTLGATPEAQALAAKKAGPVDPNAPVVPPAFAPLTPAGGSDTSGSEPPPVTPAEPESIDDLVNQETQLSEALPDEEFDAIPAAAASRSRDERFGEDQFDLEDDDEPRSNRLLFGVGAVALLAGIVLIATQLFDGGDSPSTDTNASNDNGSESAPPKTTRATTPKPADPSTITVRVFNGTQINGLAKNANDKLTAADYSTSDPQTYSTDVTRTATSVYFRPNFKSAATQVAKELGLASTAVTAITADVSTAAGETAEVVVITGADLDTGDSAPATTTG